MFVLVATKPLNDGTKGFRFNFLGVKGLYRKRNKKSRGWFKYEPLGTMNAYHLGKRSLYVEHAYGRKLYHFAGQMYLVQRKYKWIVYGDDGKIVIICTNKNIAIAYAKGR